jgi:cytochrome c peroxidase
MSRRGVASHPRYMHDGRSADLDEALADMLRTTTPTAVLDDHVHAAVVTYLESL